MSRYSLKPLAQHSDIFEVAVGWDPALDTFFVMVFGTLDDAREPALHMWRGTAFQEISTTVELLGIASDFAEIPPTLASELAADKLRIPHRTGRPISKLIARLFSL
jgi:hypothetical protein